MVYARPLNVLCKPTYVESGDLRISHKSIDVEVPEFAQTSEPFLYLKDHDDQVNIPANDVSQPKKRDGRSDTRPDTTEETSTSSLIAQQLRANDSSIIAKGPAFKPDDALAVRESVVDASISPVGALENSPINLSNFVSDQSVNLKVCYKLVIILRTIVRESCIFDFYA
uniref:Uncharacterized protein n=1 Tax=Romanomermis culicivorax TaxID=13658 RepID=A0A915J1J9_ROMCU